MLPVRHRTVLVEYGLSTVQTNHEVLTMQPLGMCTEMSVFHHQQFKNSVHSASSNHQIQSQKTFSICKPTLDDMSFVNQDGLENKMFYVNRSEFENAVND